MKISFDIDGVLDTPQGMALARRKIANGDRVYIITGRNEERMAAEVYAIARELGANGDRVYIITGRNVERMAAEVYAIARELGIPRLRVYFTNGADKWKTIQSLGIELHYDNNEEQITKIKEQTDSEAELVEYD